MRATFTSLLLGAICSTALTHAKTCPIADTSIIAHTGTPVGTEEVVDGLTLYVSTPSCKAPKVGVVYLTDVFGIQLPENKLFARAGFLTVAPDLFNGHPAPLDLNDPAFNATAFTLAHGPAATDPLVARAIAWLRAAGVEKVAATGYCYGGRYSFRAVGPSPGGADAAFAAHPSLLEDAEILAITKPASVAAAENDPLTPPARRAQMEALLADSTQPYQMSLHSGTEHGFGVRANISNPEEKFGKETAFLQAVRWFEYWV